MPKFLSVKTHKTEDKNISTSTTSHQTGLNDSITFNMDYISRRNPDLALSIYSNYLAAKELQGQNPVLIEHGYAQQLADRLKLINASEGKYGTD